MNRDQMEGGLRQVAGKVKEHLGILSGDPFIADAGRREQFIGRIQKRRGDSSEEASRQLRDFMRRNRNWNLLNR